MEERIQKSPKIWVCCPAIYRDRILALLSGQGVSAFWHGGVFATAALLARHKGKGTTVVCVQADCLDSQEMQLFATLAASERMRTVAFSMRRDGNQEKLDSAVRLGADAAGHWEELPKLVRKMGRTDWPKDEFDASPENFDSPEDSERLEPESLVEESTDEVDSTALPSKTDLPDALTDCDTMDELEREATHTSLPLLTDEELTALLGAPATRG